MEYEIFRMHGANDSAKQRHRDVIYWKQQLAGAPSSQELPADRLLLTVMSRAAAVRTFELPHALREALSELSRDEDTDLFTVLLAAFNVLLCRYTGQDDLVVGGPVESGGREDSEQVSGRPANTLALRTDLSGDPEFRELIRRVRTVVCDARAHAGLPLEDLLAELQLDTDSGRAPLFRALFSLESNDGLAASPLEFDADTRSVALCMTLVDAGDRLHGRLQYSTELFNDDTMDRMVGHWLMLLQGIAGAPDSRVSELPLLTAAERRQLLVEHNDTAAPHERDRCLHQLFEERARQMPDGVALRLIHDFSAVYEELESEDVRDSAPELLGACSFRKNPWVHACAQRFLAQVFGADRPAAEGLQLLKTYRGGVVAVDGRIRDLLDRFDGRRSLASIHQDLGDGAYEYAVYIPSADPAVSSQVDWQRRTFRVDQQLSGLVSLVKMLYRVDLLDLRDFTRSPPAPGRSGASVRPARPRPNHQDEAAITNAGTKTVGRDAPLAPVLLLGSTTGLATVGVLYLASHLRRHGIEAYCQFNDPHAAHASMQANLRKMLEEIHPRLVGISLKWFPHISRGLELCRLVKQIAPETKTVLGGDTASYFADELIRNECVDFIIRGEGEVPLLRLVEGDPAPPNCISERDGRIVEPPSTRAPEDEDAGSGVLSHLDDILITPLDLLYAPYVYVPTGRGCSMNCFYCAGGRENQRRVFGRRGGCLRDVEAAREDMRQLMSYTSTFMFDFDLPQYDQVDYYTTLWYELDLSKHFARFYFWNLPSEVFISLVVNTFKHAHLNIDLCSLSEPHRLELASMGVVKPQPTDDEILGFFDVCERHDNVEVTINLISGLPYFTEADIERSTSMLSSIMDCSTRFRGLDWGRLHAQPGAPITEDCERFGMRESASSYDDFLQCSNLNLQNRESYPDLASLNYPLIYYRDDELNSLVSRHYADTISRLDRYQRERRRAVRFHHEDVSYAELDRRAGRLATHLQCLGIGRGKRVGVCTERSLEMVVGILGVLKAGSAYVPLAPDYPAARLAYMIEDAGAAAVLTQEALLSQLPDTETPVICLDRDWTSIEETAAPPPGGVAIPPPPDDLAYVIYTSGSTGKPKGVMVSHRSICNLTLAQIGDFGLGPASRVLQFASFSFDASVSEIFTTLVSGATLCLAERRALMPGEELVQLLRREAITTITLTPSALAVMDPDRLPALETVVSAGEACRWELGERWSAGRRLLNFYGPTEATVGCCRELVEGRVPDTLTVPIGRPIDNAKLYILDRHLNPVPVGVPGELHVGGVGVAMGYVNRPELTAAAFIPDPFDDSPDSRLYKTGDLARHRSGGRIEFLGRKDSQVKVRGFRIELAEIETQLSRHPAVREAVAVACESQPGDKLLVAYLVATDPSAPPGAGELREHLKTELPDYMVPSAFVRLGALPLTPSGKVDRAALPAPDISRMDTGRAYAAPRTPVEEVLVGIWADVLKLDRVGIDDDFFELGGHSLLGTQVVSRVRDSFGVELPLYSLFENPTPAGIVEAIESGAAGARPPSVERASRDGTLPLSFAQERAWFIQQLEPGNIAYNAQATLRFRGPLDVGVLERSFTEVVRRHEIFRTTFPGRSGRPVQVIHPPWSVEIPIVDLEKLPEERREKEAEERIYEAARRPFDLAQLPLIRWLLLRFGPRDQLLLYVEHHMLHDGWSANVLLSELVEIYTAYAAGADSPLPEPPVQFADFACWQRQWMQGEAEERQLDYWKQKLAGSPLALDLPLDRPRPPVQTFGGAAPREELPPGLYDAVRALSRREGVTLFMTMLAAFAAFLHRHTGEDDICVGSGIANRRWRETENLIGMILNNVVLRNDLSGNPTFRELIRRVRDVTLEAYAHQDVPFDRVVEALRPERDPSRNPLYQVMFSFHDSPMTDLEFPGVDIELTEAVSNGSAKFDLNVIMIPRPEQYAGRHLEEGQLGITSIWEYNTDLFDASTIERMMRHFHALLESVVADPDLRLSDVPMLTEAERRRLLVEWNDTQTGYPRDACVHQVFEEQVARTPDAIAVEYGDERLTYRELNRRGNRLAHYLGKLGVERETPVGICAERSLEMVVGLLGILKAGGAYLPLEPTYPKQRLAFMLQDTSMAVLLTQQHLKNGLPESTARVICLDDDWPTIAREGDGDTAVAAMASDLAYVMYTSGSTGRPKGTAIPHRAVVRLVKDTNYVDLGPQQVFLQFAPISFDASTFEIWAPLLNGGKLVVFPGSSASLQELGHVIRRYGVTTLWLTSGLFHQMVEDHIDGLRTVRQILAGGDVLSPAHVMKALRELPDCRVINGYGPTENTTFTCCHPMEDVSQVGTPVAIGRPVANSHVYILDPHMQPVPIGVFGELYIGGDGLAREYLNRPELTAERFVPDPFSDVPGAKLYATGDLVRYLTDGTIEFRGRRDFQVKIRGFRIELGEVEARLAEHPSVHEAVVLAREDEPGNKRLTAYVVTTGHSEVKTAELSHHLAEKLPGFMVPSAFVLMDTLPLTPNGKVDRRALPPPGRALPGTDRALAPPRSPDEERMAAIWREVLGVEQVGVHDNFFELGGHSLMATQVISRIRQSLGVELPLRTVFQAPTIALLVAAIRAPHTEASDASVPPMRRIARDAHRTKRSAIQRPEESKRREEDETS